MERFFIELLKRWGQDQPWFFKVLMYLSLGAAVLIGLPGFLEDTAVWDALPGAYQAIITKVAFYAGIVGAFVAKLTATNAAKDTAKISDK